MLISPDGIQVMTSIRRRDHTFTGQQIIGAVQAIVGTTGFVMQSAGNGIRIGRTSFNHPKEFMILVSKNNEEPTDAIVPTDEYNMIILQHFYWGGLRAEMGYGDVEQYVANILAEFRKAIMKQLGIE